MSSKKYWQVVAIIIIALVLPLFLIRKEIVLVKYEQGQFLIEDEFTIGWIHSVEKEPWFEIYTVHNNQLLLRETYFKTFGAGTPSEGTIIETDDGYVHFMLNKPFQEVNMVVSENVKTTLYTKNEEIKLYELADNYSNLSFKVQKIPLWKYIRGEKYG
ncbi:DUF1850 domain-containing protein [Solibacillus sp. FSL K6-1523]|uniref:DUF1850 domain-containing protein n=1 Tax=Solibacillus sp. FSL K6-1523 TaxID=2921471 RepID=UPI0030F7883E